jgi:mRNA-degrading endonuclease YafQ of YafQ-DinJ toxin-antitoxin module
LKRLLLPSTAFIRSGRRFTRRHPQMAAELQSVLDLLAEDAFHPQLKTHKLKGEEAVLIESLDTHDEVY